MYRTYDKANKITIL